MMGVLNPFITGNPFWGTKLLGFSMWRGSGALKGLTQNRRKFVFFFLPDSGRVPRPWDVSSGRNNQVAAALFFSKSVFALERS